MSFFYGGIKRTTITIWEKVFGDGGGKRDRKGDGGGKGDRKGDGKGDGKGDATGEATGVDPPSSKISMYFMPSSSSFRL